MKTRIATIVAAAIALSFAAQNSWSEDAAVDCSTAQEDLAHLKHEKLSTTERMEKGVAAVFPISLVVHTAKGSEGKTMKMATGDYNKKIDERIAEIQKACGID
jgi:hypothetical protein